ncbi:LysR family transcriptional regulator [Pseudoalteromonas sp. MM17-2]|uniref:LysR family transcriptional regulator n=1 Tax=Pseudoalteromonas sp. MM17-2 TaxID=2917753 RepID=UPI001EF708B0|nr:LysR family transcriptional regulator [Pseudoalteromonas sp. MM17-2]MCG7542749.1 LysR family transcriptional regulator [Pseudoalteromonas sp. MM17-2]
MYSTADLETFIAIIKHQGIVNAAKQLRLSPATVSHRLAKIERHLGSVLIFRDARSLKLSPQGEIFYQRIEGILEALYDAEFEIGARSSTVAGVLKVTMPPWVFSQFVMPRLGEFEQQYPQLTLDFNIIDHFVNIVETRQDVAIRVGQLPDSGLLARKLVDNHRLLCAAPSYIARYGMPQSVAQLQQHYFVCLPWQRQFKLQVGKQVRTYNARTRFTISNSDNMTSAALAGHGIAIKSQIAIKQALDGGELVEVLPQALVNPQAPVWFLRAQHSLATRRVEVFYDFMKTCFAHL